MTGSMLIKHIASNLMSLSGFLSLAEHCYFSDKAFILMYHRISDSVADQPYHVQPGMVVSTINFEKQVEYLKKRFKVVFLEDIAGMIEKGENIGGSCAITFDDGWLDNYAEAYPILSKYKAPATIFLTTCFVGTNKLFWPEEICYYLEQFIILKPIADCAPSSFKLFVEDINDYKSYNKVVLFDKAIEILKGYLPSERDEILEYFRSQFNRDLIPRQMLDWHEAREMLASGLIRFGAHTHNHVILDQVPGLIVNEETLKSREEIEKQLEVSINTFAYPNGNFNESIQKILSENGFSSAVTTCKGFVDKKTPLMAIPRIGVHDDVSNTLPMFRSRILFKKF
ncbi:MAG: polysaccharide deacetylase family protein [Bacteriovorax sp.]|nr:polysaccharide deacetylase family protein [Bacteriovorax sp.]